MSVDYVLLSFLGGGSRWGGSEICRRIGGVSHYNLFIILQLRMNEMSKFHTACKVMFFSVLNYRSM